MEQSQNSDGIQAPVAAEVQAQARMTIFDAQRQARAMGDKRTWKHIARMLGQGSRWYATKGPKGAFGGKRRHGVCAKPTHTELRRALTCAKMQGNKAAQLVLIAYGVGKATWEEAVDDCIKVGFATFGYKRGFMSAPLAGA